MATKKLGGRGDLCGAIPTFPLGGLQHVKSGPLSPLNSVEVGKDSSLVRSP
jgi:hypothetical protein